jgi:hypothetical protein
MPIGTTDPIFTPLAGSNGLGITLGNDTKHVYAGSVDTTRTTDPIFTPDVRLPPFNYPLSSASSTASVNVDRNANPGALTETLRVTATLTLDPASDRVEANLPNGRSIRLPAVTRSHPLLPVEYSYAKPGSNTNQHQLRQHVAFLSCACNGRICKNIL